jgi:hypothetical protein
MATQTFQYASFADGAVVVEYDINDANWKVSQIRCINNSVYTAIGRIYELGELVFTAVAPSNATTSWNVQGVQLGWQPDYWNDLTETWEPGGIEMGDYVFAAQWPGEV